jgi:geranylgeranyl transferase type-2 subunit beta
MQRSGTNPTAAAVALLRMLGAIDEAVREDVRRFLREVRSSEGGFQANTRVPFADSLSTFTGLLTVLDLGLEDAFDLIELRGFLATLEFPAGGFRGALWDTVADVEYSFYALGVMGLVEGLERQDFQSEI